MVKFLDTFQPTGESYERYRGLKFSVIRELEAGVEYDKEDENHRMYEIKVETGESFVAFEVEVESLV